MKLYFSPFACSLSPHIVAKELDIKIELVSVDLATKVTSLGSNFKDINPKSYVPALELDDGRVLTEGPAIVQFLNDNSASKSLAPACGTFERAKVQEWLTFIGTELHKNFGPLFNPSASEADKLAAKDKLIERFEFAEADLQHADYLVNNTFSLADIYLFVILNWAVMTKLDLSRLPKLQAFHKRIGERPAVMEAVLVEKNTK